VVWCIGQCFDAATATVPQLTPAPLATTSPSSTATGREMLARLHEDSQKEHREACHHSMPSIQALDKPYHPSK
jgi:hypothetical protein